MDAVGKGLEEGSPARRRDFGEVRHNLVGLLGSAACRPRTSDRRRPGLRAPLAPVPRIQEILGADLDHVLEPSEGIGDHLGQVHRLHLHRAEGSCEAGRDNPCCPRAHSRLSSPTAYHGPGAVDDGPVLEPKPELEVGFLGPGGGVLPAHEEPPWGPRDGLHHQALWRVRFNCMGRDGETLSHQTAMRKGVGLPAATQGWMPG